jgi:hypothetical protein
MNELLNGGLLRDELNPGAERSFEFENKIDQIISANAIYNRMILTQVEDINHQINIAKALTIQEAAMRYKFTRGPEFTKDPEPQKSPIKRRKRNKMMGYSIEDHY